MTLSFPDVQTAIGYAGTVFGSLWALCERVRSARKSDVAATVSGKDEVIRIKDEIIEAQREEHAQFVEYRQKHHDQLNAINTKMLTLTNENAELRARSDLSPIMEQQKQMQQVTLEILKALRDLTDKVHALCEFHEDNRGQS